MKKNIIGSLTINNMDELRAWHADNSYKAFIDRNWSDKVDGFEQGEKINFYELQHKIPFLSDAVHVLESSFQMSTFLEICEYQAVMNQSFGLLHYDERFCLFCDANKEYVLPTCFCEVSFFKDYQKLTLSELKTIGSTNASLCPATLDDVSVESLQAEIEKKKSLVEEQEKQIASMKKEKEEEMERIKQELERKFQEKTELLRKKMEELNAMKESMEQQLQMLEAQIYAIRCYNGEVVSFARIASGKKAPVDIPLIVYQKVRFLDEELGKLMSVYDFEGFDSELKYFEQILQARKDVLDLFLPNEKCISLVKVSRTGEKYRQSEKIANFLESYEKYHGKTLGVLIRDGMNVFIGWLDEDKIALVDDNVFLKAQTTVSVEEDVARESTKEEMLSRFFIFNILQGLCDDGKLFSLPEKVNVLQNSPFVIFFLADGWLCDDRFGTMDDIIENTASELKKGDVVLTTQSITRDDAYDYKSKYRAYNNDRGRGDRNRTYDVHVSDCTVYPINCVDVKRTYNIACLEYPYVIKERRTACGENSWYIHHDTFEAQGAPKLTEVDCVIMNGMDDWTGIKIDSLQDYLTKYVNKEVMTSSRGEEMKAYRREYYSHTEVQTEYEYYISEEKRDSWAENKPRANMRVYEDEILNLTYLNSVFIRYVITNNNLGRWGKGNFAYAIRYLNKALEYLDEREKEESKLLAPYMELYPDWQVDLSRWRHEHGYHSLTPTRAKAFAKENTKK